jgi:hypothetical protein
MAHDAHMIAASRPQTEITMSKHQRQSAQFDQAADQARTEGVSSFGRMFHFRQSELAAYAAAAIARGLTFIIDDDGTGLFVDDSCIDQFAHQ